MRNALTLADINKTFGAKRAVADLTLTVPRGVLCGFIGPNGAGKTTTLRMILSMLLPDSGTIDVLGAGSARAAKDRIGYLPEERGVYRKMTVLGFLTHMGILKGIPDAAVRARVLAWLERVGLAAVANKKCEELSKGMQQLVQFITAVVHEPELLILDEPFSGLDPVNAVHLRDFLLELHARGTTILFSTHAMHQAEQLCEHIVMIHGGRKVLDDPLRRIRERHAPRAVRLDPLDHGADVAATLRDLPAVAAVERGEDGTYRVGLVEGTSPGAAMQGIAARVAPNRLELIRPTLEDIFIEIVTGSPPNSARSSELTSAWSGAAPSTPAAPA